DGASYTMTAGGITLYAVWTAFTYTVNFNYDGADSDTSVTTMQATYDTAFTCPAVPTKAGFVFQGWYNGETQITDNNSASIVTLKGENNAVYNLTAKWSASTEGMTFTNDGTSATLTKYAHTSTAQYVVIPETYNNYPVTAIGESAFREIYSIKSVTLPSSLITIGNYAFFQCYSLEKVVYDDVSHLTTIGDRAFKGNGRLTEFTIPATLTDIGGVVGYNAFVDAGIQKFIIENGNTTFRVENNCLIKDNMVVATCGRLENMIVPSGVTSLGFDAFPQNLKSVIIPASVTELGERAFTEKYYLTSVTFESGSMLTTIGRQAFYRCTALVNFTIPANVTSIKDSTFAGCSVLSSIIIPNKVTNIGRNAFGGCIGLTSIIIPNSVTSIVEYAFNNCKGLTSITIPASVTRIEILAFGGCSGLTSIDVEASNTTYYSAGNCLIEDATDTLILGCKNSVIPTDGSVTKIANHAFFECSGLEQLIIPSTITSIGEDVFVRCTLLKSIIIPSSVVSMGGREFYECKALETIYCEAANPGDGKQPAGWAANWKEYCNATVVWGYVAA
ncbi:MAG: leucine-rich repeat protein, partial [Clostridia bacterium]